MKDEERVLLNELQKTVDENQKILKSIRAHHRLATFFKVIYWLIILAVIFGAYYFAKPVIDSVSETKDSFVEIKNRIPEAQFIDNFLNKSE